MDHALLARAKSAAKSHDIEAARAILGELGVGEMHVLKKLASYKEGVAESTVRQWLNG